MAYLDTFNCRSCGDYVTEIATSHENMCGKCRTIEAKAKKAAHRAYLDALPIEQRIKLIEDALYELNAEKRLGALEVHHIKY